MKRTELSNAFTPIPEDCYEALMAAARGVKEETVVRKRFSIAIAMMMVLVLLVGAAFALSTWRDAARSIVETEQENGYYKDWPVDRKIGLVGALVEQGYAERTETIEELLSGKLDAQEAERLADEVLTAFTGREVNEISFMEIMTAAWGPFTQWTLEEQAWYSQLMVDMGLQGVDHTLYVLPEGPIDEAQAIAIARREIAGAYGVEERALDAYALTTSFQVPEFAQPGDTQPYWYIEFMAPAGMPSETRLFVAFWVFIHPETGELLESAQSLAEQWRKADAEREAWENDPLRLELVAFDEAYGVHWESASLEGKALWSETLAQKIIDKHQADPDFFGNRYMAMTAFRYGLPDAQAISQEQALALAGQALVDVLGRKEEEVHFYTFGCHVYYDITDAQRPLWKFFFRMPSPYHSDEAFAAEVRAYYGEERLPNYKIELDARTGEVVAAFAGDFKDVDTVEEWMSTM